MRILSLAALAAALSLAFAGVAEAQKLYRWVDKDGKVHYSDHVPPEAVDQARDELNERGLKVGSVERALTPEEIATRDARLAREAEEAAIAAEQAKRDHVLLSSYDSEEALQRSYQERFDLLEQSLATARMGIESQEKSLADLLAHAASLERAGKAVPKGIADSIAMARRQVDEQRAYMARREQERVALQSEFDQTLARYRQLRAAWEAEREKKKQG
jgi:hypothetical protein